MAMVTQPKVKSYSDLSHYFFLEAPKFNNEKSGFAGHITGSVFISETAHEETKRTKSSMIVSIFRPKREHHRHEGPTFAWSLFKSKGPFQV